MGSSSRGHFQLPLGPSDARAQLRSFTTLDGHVDSKKLERLRQPGGIGTGDRKVLKPTAFGSIFRGMNRIRTPLDKERQRALTVVGEVEQLPTQYSPVGPRTGAWPWSLRGDARIVELLCQTLNITRMNRPSDEPRAAQALDHGQLLSGIGRCRVLFGIRCDDFEVMTLAQRKQCIASA